nr:hypothetical protein [Edaphobacter aggregans]
MHADVFHQPRRKRTECERKAKLEKAKELLSERACKARIAKQNRQHESQSQEEVSSAKLRPCINNSTFARHSFAADMVIA